MEVEQLLTFFVSLRQFLKFFRNNLTISGNCIYKIGRKVTQLASSNGDACVVGSFASFAKTEISSNRTGQPSGIKNNKLRGEISTNTAYFCRCP